MALSQIGIYRSGIRDTQRLLARTTCDAFMVDIVSCQTGD
jgi:hypothetical protein